MQTLKNNFNIDQYFSNLSKYNKPALLLDYDGTLSPFQIKRDEAFPYPGVTRVLNKILLAGRTHVVIISGRRAGDLVNLLKLDKQPEIWGSHGNERLLSDGSYKIAELSPKESEGLDTALRWAKAHGLEENLEEKSAGLAFHWRGRIKSEANQIRKKVFEKWNPLQDKFGLKLLDFDGGIEIKVAGRDKGNAVQRILLEIGEPKATAYLGDDLTDEDAFKVLQGRGLCVLVRDQLRTTLADLWIKPPEELLQFLERWNEARIA